jgi:hypothetical protein
MTIYRVLSAIAVLMFATELLCGANPAVRQIQIGSLWGGLGTPQSTELIIQNHGGKYYLGRKRIDSAAVAALRNALQENAVDKPEPANLGITPEWLLANADAAVTKNNGSFVDALPDQKSLYRNSFTDPAVIDKVVPSLFRYTKFDDYPSAKIVITFEDGSTITASTSSWYLMMLPWEVNSGGTSVKSYNAHVSRAVASLMPKKATNRERLSGDGIDSELAEEVMRYIENDWKLLGVEHKAGSTLNLLRTAYSIRSADLNPYHNVVFGQKWDKGVTHEENLHAILTRAGFPPHFHDEVILLYKDGSVSGAEAFLKNGKRYEELVLSVPWLAALLAKYPNWGASVLWVHDKSFSDKAMKEFSADMHEVGKDALADEVRQVQQDVALLNIGYGDYWIILPDRRMVLWRYESVSGLLGFKRPEISTRQCTDYRAVTGGCVGAVVSPEGELQTTALH